jgi:hypothetical protein
MLIQDINYLQTTTETIEGGDSPYIYIPYQGSAFAGGFSLSKAFGTDDAKAVAISVNYADNTGHNEVAISGQGGFAYAG